MLHQISGFGFQVIGLCLTSFLSEAQLYFCPGNVGSARCGRVTAGGGVGGGVFFFITTVLIILAC